MCLRSSHYEIHNIASAAKAQPGASQYKPDYGSEWGQKSLNHRNPTILAAGVSHKVVPGHIQVVDTLLAVGLRDSNWDQGNLFLKLISFVPDFARETDKTKHLRHF